jgi:Ca2+-binding RTX toxin-like protein
VPVKLRWPLVLATAVLVIAAVPALNADAAARAECPRTTGVVYGTTGNDTIYGTPGDDVICAGSGNDTVYGKGGVDTMYGGPGNDKIYGGNAREWLFGGSGSDYIDAGAGDELVLGDNPDTGLRDKTDNGLPGNDIIFAGTGSVSAEGGPGNDIILTLGGGSKAATSTEWVYGGPGNDVLIGTGPAGAGDYFGNAGSDFISPPFIRLNPLGNVAYGGDGNDVIVAFNGFRDHVNYGELSTNVTVPVGNCKVTVALPAKPKPGDTGKVTCSLPVKVKVPGLVDGVTLKTSIDASGKAVNSVDYKPAKELKAAQAILAVVRGGFPADTCVCDPKIPGVWGTFIGGDNIFK